MVTACVVIIAVGWNVRGIDVNEVKAQILWNGEYIIVQRSIRLVIIEYSNIKQRNGITKMLF